MNWAAAALVMAMLALFSRAEAAPIVGGLTSVELTAAPTLVGAGLSVATLGSATLTTAASGNPIANFPITGGETLPGGATILHAGSGLLLAATGGKTLSLENFVVDTVQAKLFGDVFANGAALGQVALADIGSSLQLLLSQAAVGAIAQVFGITLPAGTELGIASTSPVVTPIPAAGLLLVGGLGLIAAARRRAA